MLAGLTALAIPVLIHLLLKRKKKRLRFSTIQFFQFQDEQSSRRRKLRNWLLLSIRLLIVALLVAAFARPYLRRTASLAGAAQKQRVVFVLDSSASMLAVGTDGQRWAQAKQRTQKALAGLNRDDLAALIACSAHCDVISGFVAPATITRILGDLQPSLGASNLGDGIQQAVKLLSTGDESTRGAIYVVSDFQRSACRSVAECPIPLDIEVKLLAVADLHSANFAISTFDVQPQNGLRPSMVVSSFSDEDDPKLKFDVSVDGKEVFSRLIELKAGASTNVELLLPRLKPGWHDVAASVRSKDAFDLDNTRYGSLFVPKPARVFLVETRPTKRSFEQETFFLGAALEPSKGSTNSIPEAFNLLTMSPEELISKLSGSRGQPPCEMVILPGLRDLPSKAVTVLSEFVRDGGGLILFVNGELSANRYDSELRDLLPAQLGSVQKAPETGAPWRIGQYDTNTAVFAAFRRRNSGNLRLPEFTSRFGMTPLEGAFRLATFDDEVPLLLSRDVGKGKVALVNTSADTAWSNWPKHKTFVPWLHGLGTYVSHQDGVEAQQQAENLVAGDDLDLDVAAKKTEFKLRSPSGSETVLNSDDKGRLRGPAVAAPGIYSLRDNTGKELRRFVVNIPAQESDLEAMAPTEFQQKLSRVKPASAQSLAANLFGASAREKEFWSSLLICALLLLLLEPFVANRTSA